MSNENVCHTSRFTLRAPGVIGNPAQLCVVSYGRMIARHRSGRDANVMQMLEREREDEARLLADIARGDGVAFGVIYRRYLPIVVRWCLVQTGDRILGLGLLILPAPGATLWP